MTKQKELDKMEKETWEAGTYRCSRLLDKAREEEREKIERVFKDCRNHDAFRISKTNWSKINKHKNYDRKLSK